MVLHFGLEPKRLTAMVLEAIVSTISTNEAYLKIGLHETLYFSLPLHHLAYRYFLILPYLLSTQLISLSAPVDSAYLVLLELWVNSVAAKRKHLSKLREPLHVIPLCILACSIVC